MEPTDLEFTINGEPVSPCDINDVPICATVRVDAAETPIYAELTRRPDGEGYECKIHSATREVEIGGFWADTWHAAISEICSRMRACAMAYVILKDDGQSATTREPEGENIMDIVRAHLERTGCTLRNEYMGCECGLDNLMKCGGQAAGWICDCCAVAPPEPSPDDIGIFTRRCEQDGCFASERVYVINAAEASVEFYQHGWRKVDGKWRCQACAAREEEA